MVELGISGAICSTLWDEFDLLNVICITLQVMDLVSLRVGSSPSNY